MAYSDYGDATTTSTNSDYGGFAYFVIYRPVARIIELVLLSIGAILSYVGFAPWRYSPPDAHASLALDRLAHRYAEAPRQRGFAAMKAFMERALTHRDYIDGHFDPGRA